VLRPLVRGHEVKSIGRELSISTTAASERLRSARQKLGVSTSREAVRILLAEEGGTNSSVDRQFGFLSAGDRPQYAPVVIVCIGVAMAIAAAVSVALISLLGGHAANAGAPKVVRTEPPAGAVIAPGSLKLSVTFDRAMRQGNFSFVQKDPATYPHCGRNIPVQSKDGLTFTLECTVEAGRSYEIWFNSPPYMNFKAVDGTPAVPFQLTFRTRPR
jgi:hypothetical protein